MPCSIFMPATLFLSVLEEPLKNLWTSIFTIFMIVALSNFGHTFLFKPGQDPSMVNFHSIRKRERKEGMGGERAGGACHPRKGPQWLETKRHALED